MPSSSLSLVASYRNRLLLTIAILLGLSGSAPAKMRMTASTRSVHHQELRGRITPSSIQAFESRLRPYLENKRKGARFVNALPAAQLPQEGDFLVLASVWSSLSPSFKALYQAAVQVTSKGYDSSLSPGGHFVVYYTTNPDSADRVDTIDTLGFGAGGNWRALQSGPNGIPDYVDQIAWALDSAWSMEVTGFAFHQPASMSDNGGTASRYHVFATETGEGFYGETYPDAPIQSASEGFTSYIRIRNNWHDSVWIPLGYFAHPERAVRVTCVHEFFHGIQFSMLWNALSGQYDDFPLGWIEGTAVLMEHLGFDDVKDYLQYTNLFFSDPTSMSFLVGDNVYTNSLLTIFLYDKAAPTPRIDFIKTMFYNNYAHEMQMDTNLRATSGTYSSSWVGLLNRFQTGTYFSGSRADTTRFISDAALMYAWSTVPDSGALSYSVTKSVDPYAMQIFDYHPDSTGFDTLTINVACHDSAPTVHSPIWAASCIVRGTGMPDSVFPLAIDTAGKGACAITGFRTRSEVLVIPTNGDPISSGNVKVLFKASAPLVPAPPILSQPANGIGGQGTSLKLSWNASIGASFYAMQISATSDFTSIAVSKTGLTTIFSAITGLSPNTTYFWRVNATSPTGTSAWSSFWTFNTSVSLAIFPSQPHISGSKNFIRFEGTGIQSVRIYSLDGNLVTNSATSQIGTFAKQTNWLQWQLKNNQGRSIVPGYYRAIVEQRDTLAGTNSTTVHKLLVFP